MTTTEIPDGFDPHFRKAPFSDPWEPLYSKRTERAVVMGLWIAKAHTNARGFTHGGLGSLADNAMGYSCAQATGWNTSYVTVSLAVDYVGSGQIGQWLAVEGEVIKTAVRSLSAMPRQGERRRDRARERHVPSGAEAEGVADAERVSVVQQVRSRRLT